jgi:hypothetical protein
VRDHHEPEVTLGHAVAVTVTVTVTVACARRGGEREDECQRCPSLDHPM